jgi:hypothetical protein
MTFELSALAKHDNSRRGHIVFAGPPEAATRSAIVAAPVFGNECNLGSHALGFRFGAAF